MPELIKTYRTDPTCPKQPWVIATLADDERCDDERKLSHAVRFHLARCANCRALADRLSSAAGILHELTDTEPPSDLLDRARRQTLAAIIDGAEMTGRVNVSDVSELDKVLIAPRWWWRPARNAAAAAILLSFISYWVARSIPAAGPIVTGPQSWDSGAYVEGPKDRKPRDSADRSTRLAARQTESDAPLAELPLSGKTPRQRNKCHHESHVEAAMCDKPNCDHRALLVRKSRRLHRGWRGVFDRPDADRLDTRLLRNK